MNAATHHECGDAGRASGPMALVSRVLDRAQWRRLLQIAMQIEGHFAACWPEVQDRLGLIPEKREALIAIGDDFQASRRLNDKKLENIFVKLINDPGRPDLQAWVDRNTAFL